MDVVSTRARVDLKRSGDPAALAIGVTGGIGSGKSEVCASFAGFGAVIHSADAIAKELLDSDPAIRSRIVSTFGSRLYDASGKADRKALAQLAFADPALLAELNDIVHPRVVGKLGDLIADARRDPHRRMTVVEAALIFEAGIEKMFDYVILVRAPLALRVGRAAKRDAASPETIQRRVSAQQTPEALSERADFVIQNSGTLPELRARCEFIFHLLCRMGPRKRRTDA